MPRTDSIPTLIVLALVVVSTGCVSVPGSTEPTPAESLESDIEAAEPPRSVTGTLTLSVTGDGQRTAYTGPVWLRDDGRSRIGTDGDGEFVRVDDGDRVWRYDADAGEGRVHDSRSAKGLLAFKYAEQRRYFDEYAVTEIEETRVDGRAAYHVTFDPPTDETIERSVSVIVGETEFLLPLETAEKPTDRPADRVELWIERDRQFPVRFRAEGDGFTLSIEYSDLSFDDGIPDERFEFEPPDSATATETDRSSDADR